MYKVKNNYQFHKRDRKIQNSQGLRWGKVEEVPSLDPSRLDKVIEELYTVYIPPATYLCNHKTPNFLYSIKL